MKELEKYIRDHRSEISSDRPQEGHGERFLSKLQETPVRRISFRHVLQIAASVAIILASSIWIIKLSNDGGKQAQMPENLQEANQYYISQVNYRYDQIKAWDFDSPEEKIVLLDELKELDDYHEKLMGDLKANPDDKRVITALIRHYQVKLEVMDQIIWQLNQYKSENNIDDEKAEI